MGKKVFNILLCLLMTGIVGGLTKVYDLTQDFSVYVNNMSLEQLGEIIAYYPFILFCINFVYGICIGLSIVITFYIISKLKNAKLAKWSMVIFQGILPVLLSYLWFPGLASNSMFSYIFNIRYMLSIHRMYMLSGLFFLLGIILLLGQKRLLPSNHK